MLGFNNMSTLVGHFVSSPRKREKRVRRDSRGDEREGQEKKRKRNKSEVTEEIKTFPLYPYLLQGKQALLNCKSISVGRSGDARYRNTFASLNQSLPRRRWFWCYLFFVWLCGCSLWNFFSGCVLFVILLLCWVARNLFIRRFITKRFGYKTV